MVRMALLTTQKASLAPSAAIIYTAAAGGGDQLTPGDTTFLHVKNGGGSSVTVTVTSTQACSQGQLHNLVVAVPAGSDRPIGPLPVTRFGNTSGLVDVAYSSATSVTVAAVASL